MSFPMSGYEFPIVHDMIERITCFVICREFLYHEPSWGLVVDDVRVKRRGEHVIQLSADKARRTSICQSPCLLLC